MTLHITYFVHGTTTDNQKEISSGWYDVELSDLWIKQSLELKELIDLNSFDVVFCSDLQRAVKSAELTFDWIVPIVQDPRLRECNYGTFNAKASSIVEPLQEQSITTRFPEWESYEDVKARIQSFLEDVKKDYDGKRIAIVAHKAPQLALDVIVKWRSWEEAFEKDWRKIKAWKPGWTYIV